MQPANYTEVGISARNVGMNQPAEFSLPRKDAIATNLLLG